MSTAALLDVLRRNRLLDPGALAEAERQAERQGRGPHELLAWLVQRRGLTPYQAEQLAKGEGDELLLGSYVLLEKLGEGGMGAVFKARNWKLGKTVALKLIRKERLSRPDMVRRFRQEIRAAAQLNHPHVVHVYDADEVDGTHFFVIEYVEGTDLSCLVQSLDPLRGLPLLENVSCSSTLVGDLTPLEGLPLQELSCDFRPERDAGILRRLRTLKRINNEPAERFWAKHSLPAPTKQ